MTLAFLYRWHNRWYKIAIATCDVKKIRRAVSHLLDLDLQIKEFKNTMSKL